MFACFFYNETTHLQTLTDLSVNLFHEWWGPYMVWNQDSASQFAHFQREKKMNRHAWRNLGICKSFAKLHFRQVWQILILSKKKKGGAGRSKQEKPLKFLILRKMVMLSHLMADKCCLPVTWTECRQAICVSKLSRLQDWKAQDSKSNNYLYFLESAHGGPTSCRDVPGSCAWVLSTF